MTCPSCSEPLAAGQNRCPACGSLISPPVEGALAPDPLAGRSKVEPLREIPGIRRRERTWKDEVRERVRHRRQERAGGELPLFPEETEDDASELVTGAGTSEPEAAVVPGAGVVELGDAALDLPLRSSHASDDARLELPAGEPEVPAEALRPREEPAPPPGASLRRIERPAGPAERAQAAVLDLGLLLGLWALVVYFASRAAHVPIGGLSPAWPWLVAYLAALGLMYAAYFTGVTGQTLGKLALGLRVVDIAGQPPGALRALARVALGCVGVGLAFVGLLPVLFDPAKRALHDRLLRTRVVKG